MCSSQIYNTFSHFWAVFILLGVNCASQSCCRGWVESHGGVLLPPMGRSETTTAFPAVSAEHSHQAAVPEKSWTPNRRGTKASYFLLRPWAAKTRSCMWYKPVIFIFHKMALHPLTKGNLQEWLATWNSFHQVFVIEAHFIFLVSYFWLSKHLYVL